MTYILMKRIKCQYQYLNGQGLLKQDEKTVRVYCDYDFHLQITKKYYRKIKRKLKKDLKTEMKTELKLKLTTLSITEIKE